MILPDWGPDAPFYLAAAGLVLVLVFARRVPVLRGLMTLVTSLLIAGLLALLLTERAAFDPTLARIASALRLDRQSVAGRETRIRLSPDGHFWADVTINGVAQRMLIDSGATVTALSSDTATRAGLTPRSGPMPVVLTTANGTVRAQRATVGELRLGNIVARDLTVVVAPAFGDVNVIGMNLLSKLKSWRVEGNVLILSPNHPQAVR